MKRWIVFLLGFIAGILFTFIAAFIISRSNLGYNGMTFFNQPGECLSTNNFEVMQVIGDDCALAHEIEEWDSDFGHCMQKDLLVLVINDNGEYYYDDQIINVPKGKCMRQVGIYKYRTKMDMEKTVPIVMLMDK